MNTTAIVIPQADTVELQQVALKALGPADVLVRTTLTAISAGTERMLLKGVMPHPMLQFPVVPGYETVGEVIDAGEAARAWLGKRVYVGGNYGFADVNPAFGGQSAHIVAAQTQLTELGALSDEQGVLLALAATALHGIDQALGPAGTVLATSVLILGQGIVGQLAARFARARGMHVSVTERVPERLAITLADQVIDLAAGPLPRETQFDVLIDATGKMEAIAPLLMHVRKGGRVLLLGYYDCLSLPYQPIFLRELTLVACTQWAPGDLARARDAIVCGDIDVSRLITHRMPMAEAAAAFEIAFNDTACLKMTLQWPQTEIHGQ